MTLARLRRYYPGLEPLDMTLEQVEDVLSVLPELVSEEHGETNHTAVIERRADTRRRREELIW